MSRMPAFLAELKRRKVHTAAAAYAGIAFILWQATEVLVPSLALPDWVATAVVAGTLLGFPVVLALSWVFDISLTPHRDVEATDTTVFGRKLREIHDRSLWQTGVSYVVGSWIILQVTETLSSLIGLPLWMGRGVLIVLLLGAPVVMGTAWRQSRRDRGADESMDRLLTWRNAALAWLGAFLLLGVGTGGYLGMRSAGLGPVGSLLAKEVLQEAERVLLADFANRTSNPSLGTMATEMLRVDLAQSASITMVPPAVVADALRRMERGPDTPLTEEVAVEVALREGVKAVIVGEVSEAGARYLLSLRLVASADGSILSAHRVTAREQDLIRGMDQLSARLRERIGEPLRSIQGNPPLARVTTGSLQALEKYALAERANNRGDFEGALSLLRDAVIEDSTFAMAHRKIGVIQANDGRDAQEAISRAYELRERLTERERLITVGSYHYWVSGDYQAALHAYATLLDLYPADPTGLHNLGVIYWRMDRQREAVDVYQRAIDTRVATAVTYQNVISGQFALGQAEGAAANLRAFGDAYPGHPFVDVIGIALASAQFDFDEVERRLEATPPSGAPVEMANVQLDRFHLALVRGRLSAAEDSFTRAYDLQAQADFAWFTVPPGLVWPVYRGLVKVQAGVSAGDEASEVRRQMSEAGYSERLSGSRVDLWLASRDDLWLASFFARVGDRETARSLIADFEADHDEVSGSLWAARGDVSLAEGRLDDAFAEFAWARETATACDLCYLPELGEAHFRARDWIGARTALEGYVGARQLYRFGSDAVNLGHVLYRLGQVYEELADTARAADHYRRFVDLWQGADPELQPRVERARAAIARLGSG